MQVTLFFRGDQIATFSGLTSGGNADDMRVTLFGVETLGGPEDVFRVVVRQVNDGDDRFLNGQLVDVYDMDDNLIFSDMSPGHDEFQGRASSTEHQVFSGSNVLFSVDPIVRDANDVVQFGPGLDPPRDTQLSFDAFPTVVPCFVEGTRIATPDGEVPVEALRPGDLVLTRDRGPQPVRWVGRRAVPGRGVMAPVEVGAGRLGARRPLLVSPQHRLLIRDSRAELLFGVAEVLAPALGLVDGTTVRRRAMPRVVYVHLLLDRHEILLAEGCAAESLLPGMRLRADMPGLDAALAQAAREHGPARPLLTVAEARLWARGGRAATRVPGPRAGTGRALGGEVRPGA
jgi:hypothetical protein